MRRCRAFEAVVRLESGTGAGGRSMTALWYTRCPAPTAASVAIRLGWLEEEFAPDNIPVRSISEAPDEAVRQAHYSHDHPALFRFGGYVPPLQAIAQGVDIRVIGLNWHDRVSGLYALPERGLKSAADLKGARIALPIRKHDRTDWWRATVLAGVDHFAATSGLERSDLHLVPIEIDRTYYDDATAGPETRASLWGSRSQFAVQREEVAALYRGEVDAIYSDAALAAILTATTGAVPVVRFRGYEDDSEAGFGHPIVLTVSAALLDQRPDLVDRWMSRLLAAQDWVLAQGSEARRIFASDTGLPEALLDHGYSRRLVEQVDVSLAPGRVALLRRKYDHLFRHGFLKCAYDLEAMIDHRPLERAAKARAA
jgi:ABC-type nitrate/sulfonate/bicarbonate transport system substrate-binding protein